MSDLQSQLNSFNLWLQSEKSRTGLNPRGVDVQACIIFYQIFGGWFPNNPFNKSPRLGVGAFSEHLFHPKIRCYSIFFSRTFGNWPIKPTYTFPGFVELFNHWDK